MIEIPQSSSLKHSSHRLNTEQVDERFPRFKFCIKPWPFINYILKTKLNEGKVKTFSLRPEYNWPVYVQCTCHIPSVLFTLNCVVFAKSWKFVTKTTPLKSRDKIHTHRIFMACLRKLQETLIFYDCENQLQYQWFVFGNVNLMMKALH